MFYDAVENAHGLKRDPFKALVVPRPIGWISSLDGEGRLNLAPYSYFNAVSDRPHIVMFSSSGWKDSVANIEETREFTCSLATYNLKGGMNQSSAPYPREISEFEAAGLEMAASRLVKPPRVAASPVALECRYLQTIALADEHGAPADSWMVLGQVVGIHIDDALISEGMVDITKARPIARLGYMDYAVVDEVFAMQRPKLGD